MSVRSVPRFSAAERVYHWVYAIAFIVLAVTGFVLFWPITSMTAGEAGQTNRLLHRIFGVVLIVAPIVIFLVARRPFLGNLAEAFSWSKADLKSLRILMTRTYWNGDMTGLPPQGKFMAGQKSNIVCQTLLFFALAASGLIMWFGKGAVPQWIMQLVILVHALSAIGATVFAIVHIYMVTTLAFTRDSISTMFSGGMPEELARSHHPRWFEKVTGRQATAEK